MYVRVKEQGGSLAFVLVKSERDEAKVRQKSTELYTREKKGSKRGVITPFHHVSLRHLDRYVNELGFQWNSCKTLNGERVVRVIEMVKGKRRCYRNLNMLKWLVLTAFLKVREA